LNSHNAEYIVYDSKYLSTWPADNRHESKKAISEIAGNENYGIIKEENGVFLLKKNTVSQSDFKVKELYYPAISTSYSDVIKKHDILASEDSVLYIPANSSNKIMFFGPYVSSLSAGKYLARFSLRCTSNNSNNSIAVIDVNYNSKTIAEKSVNESDLNSNGYTVIELEFTLTEIAYGLETRLFYKSGGDLYCDFVSIKKLNN
jgi:hypothetical protein